MASAGNNVFFNGYTDKYNYELYAGDAPKINNANTFSFVEQNKKHSSFSATVLENPIHSDLKIKITSDKKQTINIVVSDERGLVLTKQNIDVNKGINQTNIQLLKLTTGVYVAKLTDDTGNSVSIKLLK
jgi:type IX secretion system substrate protein